MPKLAAAGLCLALFLLPATSRPAAAADDPGEALRRAASEGDRAKVQELLAAGVDVNAANAYGGTALAFAADKGHLAVVELLLERGADPNVKDRFYESTPLVWAVIHGRADIVRALLAKGAQGETEALMGAAGEGHAAIVKVILERGKLGPETLSDALVAASKGESPQHAEVVALLQAAGAKPPVAVAVDPAVLKTYEGTFVTVDDTVTITLKDGKLTAATDDGNFTLAAIDPVTFRLEEIPGFKVTFQTESGKVRGLTLDGRGRTFQYEKKVAPAAWPSFRGTQASGVAEGPAPTAWNGETGTNVLWKTPIPGLAHSSPVVWGDRVYVTTAVSSEANPYFRHGLYGDVDSVESKAEHSWRILALDRKTGKVLWEQVAHTGVPTVKRHMKATHANSTPATDGEHVVALFGSAGLYCYKADGTLKWKRDLGVLDAGWFYDPSYQWEYGASPILYKNLVIVQADLQKSSFLAAYDLADGREVWRTQREEIPSWATPTVFETAERAELVTNATKHVRGYDPLTGKELWRLAGNSEIVTPTPIAAHGFAYVTSGYAPIQPIYAIRLGVANGDITLAEGKETNEAIAWSKQRGGPYMPTPIVYGDHLYTCANNGILTVYDAKTGAQVYRDRIAGTKSTAFTASPVAADGKLYFASEDGEVYVVKAGPKPELIATNPMGEVLMATPAIVDGMVLVRGRQHLFALGEKIEKAEENPAPAGR